MEEQTKQKIIDFFSQNPTLFVVAGVFVLVVYFNDQTERQEQRIDRITDQIHKVQTEDTMNTRKIVEMLERVLMNKDESLNNERAIAAAIETMRRNQQVLSARVTRMESRIYVHPASPP